MNTKKIIGIVLWVLAFAIPFKFALLDTEAVGNIKGLVSFVVMLVLVFTGYALFDSGKQGDSQGH
ncbi:MAG: hypothetical protein IPN85_09985 [Flavobacteriales bacterium]|nr:hypothetical protein [Flavobacteriales bacterium]MBK9288887.1 hypothetical protein [Flavobacteriales bacterium]